MTAIYFGQAEQFLEFLRQKYGDQAVEQALAGKISGMLVSLAYYPEINVYNGRESIQVIVKNYC